MCGILSFVDFKKKFSTDKIISILCTASKLQSIRGPDNNSTWINEEKNVGLAHNRLSILDLSSNGNQPMTSQCGRYTISYNGEIYNFLKLKEDLKQKVNLKSNSDTEVILEHISENGIKNTINKIDGMFSIAV
tara:strand:- start:4609 stop:5007 length:399 start_codon:yes stop_codon:yes gene_type:complete